MESKNRINVLDGFRFLAILPVLLFHFYARWTKPIFTGNYYPYDNSYSTYFKHGNLGVAFFFIISGFVIYYTLEACSSFKQFIAKRLIRLVPTMVLCSVITYFIVPLVDPSDDFPDFHSKTALNFLPSLTFTNPFFWNKLFNNNSINYVNGSYWSLWVELTFYVIAGNIFFLNQKKFVSNWLYTVLFILLVVRGANVIDHKISIYPAVYSIAHASLTTIVKFDKVLQLYGSGYNLYFSLGILFYCLYQKIKVSLINYVIIVFMLIFYMTQLVLAEIMIIIFMVGLFLVFIYRNEYLNFLNAKLFSHIGLISYSLYLIHEGIGVIVINRLSTYFSSTYLIGLVPLGIIGLLIGFSSLVYEFYEKPIGIYLKKMIKSNSKNNDELSLIHKSNLLSGDPNEVM